MRNCQQAYTEQLVHMQLLVVTFVQTRKGLMHSCAKYKTNLNVFTHVVNYKFFTLMASHKSNGTCYLEKL